MNIYAAPLASISSIIETISLEKEQIIDGDCIFIILGDFNIDIHVSSQRSKQLQALEEMSTQNGPFNFYSNSMSSCVSQ